jgi:Domain of unknown function (DUF222)
VDSTSVLVERAREAAVAASRLMTAMLDVADTAVTGFDADEIAFALVWTQSAARSQLSLARYLRDVLPDVFAALSVGDIDARRAWVFYDVLATATDTIAAQVASAVLAQAPGLTASELRRRLRRRLIAADPHGTADRTAKRIATRYVGTSPDGDGTAALFGVRLPAARAAAAFERVDAYARGAKTAGDDRTLDQLRADTFLDLLEGVTPTAGPVHRRGIVEITIPWATATGQSDEPGDLAGFGPVDPVTLRDWLAELATRPDVDWRYSSLGSDGTLLDHGRIPRLRAEPPVEADPTRRHPGAALTRWIIARDRTCRAPGCTTPARSCDIDHTIDHVAGGLTTHDNLGLLCRHHHRLKHEAGWTLTQPTPGRFEWRSPTGRIYRT